MYTDILCYCLTRFSHCSKKYFCWMMFLSKLHLPFVCVSGLDSDYRHTACPASPQFSSMLSASEDTHSCHFQDGNKRQTEYFNTQDRHAVSSSINSQTVAPEKVTLVVDGTRFAVNPQIFTAHPDTMLGRWVIPPFSTYLKSKMFIPFQKTCNVCVVISSVYTCRAMLTSFRSALFVRPWRHD